jgi:small GTP-binding protein
VAVATQTPQLLRFATAGSVDDGKSTLIGRLLYDSKALMADELGTAADLARLTDGLRAEREQGITIDVAYRHFSTPRRRFIIADTPGHAQYTRNMVTGASTADVAVVLVDAREGLLTQSRRHAAIAGLLRIPRIVLAVNKMDLVDYDADAFRAICADFRAWAGRLDVEEITCIPISALRVGGRVRLLHGEPHDRSVHPHRRGDERHGRGRDGRRCLTRRVHRTSSGSAASSIGPSAGPRSATPA